MGELRQLNRSTHTDSVAAANPLCQRTTARWLRSFFWTTRQDVFVRQIGYQALQTRVLIAQLTNLADLGHPMLAKLLRRQIEARLTHSEL